MISIFIMLTWLAIGLISYSVTVNNHKIFYYKKYSTHLENKQIIYPVYTYVLFSLLGPLSLFFLSRFLFEEKGIYSCKHGLWLILYNKDLVELTFKKPPRILRKKSTIKREIPIKEKSPKDFKPINLEKIEEKKIPKTRIKKEKIEETTQKNNPIKTT